MLKIFLQLIITIFTFVASYFRKKINKRYTIIIAVIIIILFIINSIIISRDDKIQSRNQEKLNEEIKKISQKSENQELKIDELLGRNQKLESGIEDQTKKIDEQTKEIKTLCDLLAKIMDRELKPTKSYAEAKNLFVSAVELTTQGNNKAAADKFLELREIAVKEQAYESAAISSSLASFRFEEIGEKQEATKLQSEAGKFLMKLK